MEQYLFVYGTLRRPARNRYAREFHRGSTFIGPAKVQAKVYPNGAYTAMVCSRKPGDWVQGQVFRLRNPEEQLPSLDQYEGPDYRRVLIRVFTKSGRTLRSWAYLG